MNRRSFQFGRRLSAVLLLGVARMLAQPLFVESFTVDGGGGTSSGGRFSLSGTIGQSDAGQLDGGAFLIEGGFWNVVQETVVPGTPALMIHLLENGGVQICWPSAATGFALQEQVSLAPPIWTPSVVAIEDNGAMKCVTVPSPGDGTRFFRLAK